MNNKINIAYTINRNYLEYLYVSLLSLLSSNVKNDIAIHILTSDVFEDEQSVICDLVRKYEQECHFYYIGDLESYNGYVSTGYSLEVYLRFFLPWTLKSIDKVLYLDTDTYIKGDIAPLYNTDLSNDIALAGCMDSLLAIKRVEERNDIFKRDGDYSYYNAGVMLWNLEYFRRETSMNDFNDAISLFGNRLLFNDQDVLNYLCYRKIVEIDKKYNFLSEVYVYDFDFEKMLSNAVIIHYAGGSPWKKGLCDRADIHLWWKLAQETPIYTRILEKTINCITDADINRKNIERISRAYTEYKLKGYDLLKRSIFQNCSSISIYGYGAWGRLLLREMSESNIVKYIFDRNSELIVPGYELKSVDDISVANETELLVITPTQYYKQIYDDIADKVNVKIVNLVDLFESCR